MTNTMSKETIRCCWGCGDVMDSRRWDIGKRICMPSGESEAQQQRKSWCIVPMPKSNYILVTDLSLLKGLNSSHKGGLT